jgi:D-alanyl-D-alanine carboxypeptidase
MLLPAKRSFPYVWRPAAQPDPRELVVFDKGFVREFGLVGAWILNQRAPRDLSGNRRHAVPVGTTLGPVAGPVGSFTNFAGDNNNHRLDLGAITQNDPLSLAGLGVASFAWRSFIPSGTLNNAFCRVIDKSDGGSAANGYALWFVPSLNKFEFAANSLNGPRNVNTATRDAWESWAFRYVDGTFSNSSYFLNGVDVNAHFANTSATIPTGTTNAAIGNWNHSTDRAWNGGIEYLYAFNQALPDSEFARIARQPYRYLVPEAAQRIIFLPRPASGIQAGAGTSAGQATAAGEGASTAAAAGASAGSSTANAVGEAAGSGVAEAAGTSAGSSTANAVGAATAAGAGTSDGQATVSGVPGGVLPEITALGAYVVNFDSDQVYYTLQPTTTRKQFSCVKALTALVMLQEYPTLGDLATTTTIEAGDAEGGTGNNLNTGDVISLYELLENLWVPSSNVSAQAISRVVGQKFLDEESGGAGDPYDRFLTEMSAVAAALGMINTTFDSPSGITSANQTSSAADLAILYEAAMNNEIIAGVAALDAADIDIVRSGSPTSIPVTSGIAAMYDYAGGGTVIGAKGGINGAGNQCNLVTIWQAPNLERVTVVLMHCPTAEDRITDTTAILDQLQVDFPELVETAAAAGTSAGQATAPGEGASTAAAAGTSAGSSTANATGAATAAGEGTSDGQATAPGEGASIAAAAGTSDGSSTADAVGSGETSGVSAGAGSSVGSSTASATGAATAAAAGTSDGSSTADAVGAAVGAITAGRVTIGARAATMLTIGARSATTLTIGVR